ncbi:MAG: hypothetical protein WAO07_13225 [Desulfobacterales bacterium]
MAKDTNYECKSCGRKVTVESSDAKAPDCCQHPMAKAERLPVCSMTETAEQSRMEDMGEPCDDGRSGKL